MIADVGKTPCVLRLEDGRVLSFFNTTITATSSISYKDTNGDIRYTMTIGSDVKKGKYRALHFIRSYPMHAIDNNPIPVIFTSPETTTTGSTSIECTPLYECIAPQITTFGKNNYQLTFWTNITDLSVLSKDSAGNYIYTAASVKKFSTNKLGDVTSDANATKVLCTAPIHLELLSKSGIPMLTPVIQSAAVLATVSGENYALDFSGGGSAGLRRHAHSSNSDGGFAFSVYSPSAVVRPLSWF